MGIKFYCPNGHKLNVKTFLAGKKAICPKCGVKVVVPSDMGAAESDPVVVDAEALGALATAQASAQSRAASDAQHAPLSATSSRAETSTAAGGSPALVNGPAAVDPIDEEPTAVWYVRPPSGG